MSGVTVQPVSVVVLAVNGDCAMGDSNPPFWTVVANAGPASKTVAVANTPIPAEMRASNDVDEFIESPDDSVEYDQCDRTKRG